MGAMLDDGVLPLSRRRVLFSDENVARLFTEMPRTLTGFAPLGLILVIMSAPAWPSARGCSALIRAVLRERAARDADAVGRLIGMVSHHASDAGYVVFIPLAALLYAAVGRHPLAGLAAAFAAVSGGHAGNVTPARSTCAVRLHAGSRAHRRTRLD